MEQLHIQNDQIVDANGQAVRLRGVCVGGWMNMESFINGYPGTEQGMRLALTEALGDSKANFFLERWLDAFFDEEDVIFIRSLGANVVRLPLNYRHFEQDEAPFHYLETGFARLDRAVDWCEKHGLYVILDLHAAPGWQNPDWHSDNPSQHALLWEHPHFQERFRKLWQAIAAHYAGNPTIAGYDLLNEPLTNAASEQRFGHYAPKWKVLNDLYDRTVQAIRQVDQAHIIFLEGDGFATLFGGLDAPFCENLAVSSHNYNRAGWGPGAYPGLHREGYWDRQRLLTMALEHQGAQYARKYQIPLWVGEFGSVFNGSPRDRADRLRGMDDQIGVFEELGLHWTSWTYKDVGVMGWVTLDPESPYLFLMDDLLRKKLAFHTDSWMYWLPSTPAKESLGGLAQLVQQAVCEPEFDSKRIQGQLVKAALGGVVGEMLQLSFARRLRSFTENELDLLAQSFSLKNCRPNQDVLNIVRKYLAVEEILA
jgi:aryl-phospho-beta-D-glucosidase BglC (GH1 family)